MSKKTYRHQVGRGKFLAPESVGSSVRYTFDVFKQSGKRNFAADFVITDCDNRVWMSAYGADGPAHMRKKLEGLQHMVEDALDELDIAEDHYESLKTKGRK